MEAVGGVGCSHCSVGVLGMLVISMSILYTFWTSTTPIKWNSHVKNEHRLRCTYSGFNKAFLLHKNVPLVSRHTRVDIIKVFWRLVQRNSLLNTLGKSTSRSCGFPTFKCVILWYLSLSTAGLGTRYFSSMYYYSYWNGQMLLWFPWAAMIAFHHRTY